LKKQWVIPPEANADFVWHMEEVLDVYIRPYDERHPQVCMDETSKQLVGETRVRLPMEPGQPERFDYEYARNGVAELFMFCEPLAGRRWVTVSDHRTRVDWAQTIKDLVDVRYPLAERIVLVMDNLNTHTPASLYETFAPVEAKRILDRLEIHYTPKHGSWLNIAEIELSILSRQCLDQRIPDQSKLVTEVVAWQERRDAAGGKVNWRFTTENARIKLKTLYPSIQE